ncbi:MULTISPECIES: M15 family metallopeptidase [Bacteria]
MASSRARASAALLLLAAAVSVVVGAGFVSANGRADLTALGAFNTARNDLIDARDTLASEVARSARMKKTATDVYASARSVVDVADPALLSDATTRDAALTALESLVAHAGLTVAVDGTATVSMSVSSNSAASSVPVPPHDRDARYRQAADMHAEAIDTWDDVDTLRAESAALSAELTGVRKAAEAIVTSAHAYGAATAVPELTAPEAAAAYATAVAALESAAPTEFVAALRSYQESWQAAVASHDAETAKRAAAAAAAAAARAATSAGGQRASCTDGPTPTYIRGILVVNKSYAIPPCFGGGLTAETRNAFEAMRAEAAGLGLRLVISSGYRSYATQQSLYGRFVAREGVAGADRHSARPGHSEHQSGLAFDLNSISEAFGYTGEGVWVRDNAHRFGFIVRYPPGKEGITGYIWEPWHLRYVGAAASDIYASGLSLEEYLGVSSQYAG